MTATTTLPLSSSNQTDRPAPGLRMSMIDGTLAQMMVMLTTGAVLAGYAVALGLPKALVGLIASAIPISQMAQIPAVPIIERSRRRKHVALVSSAIGRLLWIPIAFVPWMFPDPSTTRTVVFLALVISSFFFQSISACAYASWMRDLIPLETMGRFFGRRLALSTGAGALVALGAGFGLDRAKAMLGPVDAYIPVLLLGAAIGILGLAPLVLTPEPDMAPPLKEPLHRALLRPLEDADYRQILRFSGAWSLAVHLASPFFAVYMLERIGLSMGTILSLSVIGQLTNVLFLSLWGPVVDRLGNVGVLRLAVLFFTASFLIWPSTTLPERHQFTLPLLALGEVLMGIGTSGIVLCGGNLSMKSAPKERAATFLATNALVTGCVATVAPLLGGWMGDAFSGFELRLLLEWEELGAGVSGSVPTVVLSGLDFVFIAAFLLGLYAGHRTLAITEPSERRSGELFRALLSQVRRPALSLGGGPGHRSFVHFPYALLRPRGPTPKPGPASGR